MFLKEQGLSCLTSHYVLGGKITLFLRGHDYYLRQKGLSCSRRQLELLLLEDMIVLREKKI
jgi:hypothetical protein